MPVEGRQSAAQTEALIQDATFTSPQARGVRVMLSVVYKSQDVCRTLSGHIGGTVMNTASLRRLSIIINKIEYKQQPLRTNGICQHERSVIELRRSLSSLC